MQSWVPGRVFTPPISSPMLEGAYQIAKRKRKPRRTQQFNVKEKDSEIQEKAFFLFMNKGLAFAFCTRPHK